MQTLIKLLLKEQFDQGLHCLSIRHDILDTSQVSQWTCFKFRKDLVKSLSVLIFWINAMVNESDKT